MEWFLDKRFWEEQFNLNKEYLDYIFALLERKEESCTIHELVEKTVRLFLESGEWIPPEYKDSRVFSHSCSYNQEDKIIVFKKDSKQKNVTPIFGVVKKVENQKNCPVLYGKDGESTLLETCDIIKIVFPNGEWQSYICNSPDYVNVKKNLLTPEVIIEEFRDILFEKVNTALASDGRFSRAKEKWILTPPKEIINTLTNRQIEEGSIRITSGLRAMFNFYNINSEVYFIAYGGYLIKGIVDYSGRKIYSEEIKYWFEENHLSEGDKIYIKAPEEEGHPLLYTNFERSQTDVLIPEQKIEKEKLNLRHEIYKLFKNTNKFLHLKEIYELLSHNLKKEIHINTVSATLHFNDHLFKKIDRTNLWGLVSWGSLENIDRLDIRSLLLAIKEDDLVYKTLDFKGVFMNVKDIAEEISEYFHLRKNEILESTFIDFNDSRIIRDKNGRFGLKIWVEEWRKELQVIENSLDELKKLEGKRGIIENNLLRVDKELEALVEEKKQLNGCALDIGRKEKLLLAEKSKLEKNLKEIVGHKKYLDYKQNIKKLWKRAIGVFLISFVVCTYVYIFQAYGIIKVIGSINYVLGALIISFLLGFVHNIIKKFINLKIEFSNQIKQERHVREEIKKIELTQRQNLEEKNQHESKVQNAKDCFIEKQKEKSVLEKELQEVNSGLGRFDKSDLLSQKTKYQSYLQDITDF